MIRRSARAQLRAQTFHASHWIAVVTEMLFDYLIAIVSSKAAEIGMSEVTKKVDTFAPSNAPVNVR